MTTYSPGTILHLILGFTNIYAVTTDDGVVLVEAGPDYDGAWDELQDQLHAYSLSMANVRAVLLSHAHLDHAGLARRWQEQGALVMAGRGEEVALCQTTEQRETIAIAIARLLHAHGFPDEVIATLRRWRREGGRLADSDHDKSRQRLRANEGGTTHMRGPMRMTPVMPDRLLANGDELTIGGVTIHTIICPGHTPAHALYSLQSEGALFTGDHILPSIVPILGVHFIDDRYETRMRSLPAYLESLRKVQDLSVQRVLPGHQWEFDDLRQVVDRLRRYHEQRARRTLRIVREYGAQTVYQIMTRLWPHLSPRRIWAALAEILDHMDLLEERGQVVQESREGFIVYRAV